MATHNMSYTPIPNRESGDSLSCSEATISPHQHLLEKEDHEGRTHRGRRYGKMSCLLALTHGLLLSLSVLILMASIKHKHPTDRDCAIQTSAFSPAWEAVEHEYIRFQGALLDQNPYKGNPSPELDAAWDHIVNMDLISVGPDVMKKLHKPLTQAKYPENSGGGFSVGLEVFHQLHCLNLVRQYTHFGYYSTLAIPPQPFTDSNATLRLHVDHCIDILRQVLMCNGDVGLVTNSWVIDFDDAYPDFNSWHKCRKFEPLLEYHIRNRVGVEAKRRPEDPILPHPPCEGAARDAMCP